MCSETLLIFLVCTFLCFIFLMPYGDVLPHFAIEFVRLSSVFVQDPKIVGPDQTSNRIN